MADGRKFNGTSVSRNGWTKVENLTLQKYYTEPKTAWSELTAMLPRRSEAAIMAQASKLGLHRRRTTKSSKVKVIKRLWELREKEGLTRAQLAKKMGYHPGMLARWERGESFPNILKLVDWCEALGAELNAVYHGTPLEPTPEEDDFPMLTAPDDAEKILGDTRT